MLDPDKSGDDRLLTIGVGRNLSHGDRAVVRRLSQANGPSGLIVEDANELVPFRNVRRQALPPRGFGPDRHAWVVCSGVG